MTEKVIITAAITGAIHTPSMSPYLPITAQQIADEAERAYEAGAAVAHIHVRNPENGQPAPLVDLFGVIAAEVKRRCPMVICMTTGGGLGQTTEQRVAVVSKFRPELASCNCGSINFALFPILAKMKEFKYEWERQYLQMTEDFIFPNTFKTLREYTAIFAQNYTKPELEIYDLGMINNAAYMIEAGHLKKPIYMQFVLGVLGGAPATVENVMFFYKTAQEAIGEDFAWSAFGAGKTQMTICTQALLLGGHVRVGLEDSLYLEKGVMAKSNAEQVAKIVHIARELGREPASPDEARQMLGLKGLDNVNY